MNEFEMYINPNIHIIFLNIRNNYYVKYIVSNLTNVEIFCISSI